MTPNTDGGSNLLSMLRGKGEKPLCRAKRGGNARAFSFPYCQKKNRHNQEDSRNRRPLLKSALAGKKKRKEGAKPIIDAGRQKQRRGEGERSFTRTPAEEKKKRKGGGNRISYFPGIDGKREKRREKVCPGLRGYLSFREGGGGIVLTRKGGGSPGTGAYF